MASDLSVASSALIRLGDKSINSFSEGSSGPLAEGIFPDVKKRVETSAPWRFNTVKSLQLDKTTEVPPTQYQFAYQLPPDMLFDLPRTVWNSAFNAGRTTPFMNFDIFENKLLSSAEQIFIDYQVLKDTENFPAHVVNLYIYAMMAELAFPVTDQQSTSDAAQTRAWGLPAEGGKGGYFKEAQRIDSQGHPSQSIKNFSLTAVRHGGI